MTGRTARPASTCCAPTCACRTSQNHNQEAPELQRLAFQANREVRHTVIRVISAHLRKNAKASWQGELSISEVDRPAAEPRPAEVDRAARELCASEVDRTDGEFNAAEIGAVEDDISEVQVQALPGIGILVFVFSEVIGDDADDRVAHLAGGVEVQLLLFVSVGPEGRVRMACR